MYSLKEIIEPLVKRIRALEAKEAPRVVSGTATVLNEQTSVVVTHGLPYTPVAGDIMVWFCQPGSSTSCYVDTYTATQFTIRVNANPGITTAIIGWKAIR